MERENDSRLGHQLSQCLQQRKNQFNDEVRHFPTPIPACDAQYNHLMAQRAELTRDIGRLGTMLRQNRPDTDFITWAEGVIQSASYLDDATRQAISALLRVSA